MSSDAHASFTSASLPADGPLYVAGVGVAPDALDPLRQFLAAAGDLTGVAFVVVPCGPTPAAPSPLDLLSLQSALPTRPAGDGTPLAAGVVYMAHAGARVDLVGELVVLRDDGDERAVERPFDTLLRSITEHCAERSVAVLLADGGEDGAAGLRAVSAAGGLALAHAPEDAESGWAGQVADITLAPDELPAALQRALGGGSSPVPPDADRAGLDTIFRALRGRWGIDFSSYKPTTIGRGIHRRVAAWGSRSVGEYAAHAAGDVEEIDRLYRDLLIRVTEFFRTPEAFRALEERVIPELFRGRQDEIRAWVAGCSTGEEVYSLAMLLHEQAAAHGFVGKITIFATDVHRPSLSAASQGVYAADRLATMTPERRLSYFQALADGTYKVAATLRRMIVFAPQDLISDPPFTRIDLVCCRNLLIYLRPPLQEKALSSLHFALRSGGFLFLGLSEGLGGLAGEFTAVDSRLKIFRKSRDMKLPLAMMPRDPALAMVEQSISPMIPRPQAGIDRQLLYDYDRLLERYMPAGVLLDDQRRPLHYFGGVARYLQPLAGRAESSFLQMLSPALSLAISGGIQRAAVSDQPIMIRGLRVATPDGARAVDVTVERLGGARAQLAHTIITFVEIDMRPVGAEPPEVADQGGAPEQRRIEDLEQELSYTREDLHATIEELQTSNEELQTSNEELLAANEELQSVNEGLQSLNEELQSLNAEFELKNSELRDLNRDYDDLIRSTRVAILSLDRDLRIMRYSPSIETFFDLRDFDLGRPITSIAYKLGAAEPLIGDLWEVMAGGGQIEREVRAPDGRWFQQRMHPILNERRDLQGVVLMYIDISELKQAQELALLGAQRLRGAIESSLDAFYLLESVRDRGGAIVDLRFVEANPVGAARLATTRDTLLGRRMSEVIPDPALAAEIVADYGQIAESGESVSREILSGLGEGQRWLRQQVVKVGDGVAVTSADISDRKQYEAEIAAQRLRLDLALDGGELGTWDVDLRRGELHSDARTLAIFGFAQNEVEDSRAFWRDRIHPDDIVRTDAARDAHLRGETPAFEGEMRVCHRDGSWRWVLSRGRVVERDDSGAPVRMSGTYMDITERVEAEAQLRESERRFHTLSESSPAGIFRADVAGDCTYANPRWCEIVGISVEEALGTGWSRQLHPEDAGRVAAAWADAVAAGAEFQMELRFLRPDGVVRWVFSQAAPEIDEGGHVTGYVGMVIDISRRLAAEEQLRQQSAQLAAANEDLARAARLKDQFLANMSHELRTPLTGVIGFSEALDQGIYGDLTDPQRRAVRQIFDSGQHLLSLINDILDLARIGAGQVDLKLGPVLVEDVCAEAIDLIRPMLVAKAQRFSYARPPAGLAVEADVLRLRQILINLLSNAVKFTPEGGELGLDVTPDLAAGAVRFVVWDHGIGIAPAQQPLLFQPFMQLDSRLAREQAGTGLGLALVRQLTTLHGGEIELRSAPGEGSAFTLVLPQRTRAALAETSTQWAAARRPAGQPQAGHPLILLAEDDPAVATLIGDYLRAQGCDLIHVGSGDEVLPRMRDLRPQLALIDIQLPGLNGLEIIAQLRADADSALARTPVIAVTALAMVGDRERCLAAGADDYMSKPIRLDDLGAMVARMLLR
ncbi:PAS domain-containing protein [Oscillochloris sp. ZM17-4]|uniref:CheR family methyltransferase n=1 Tax=Oscillochloris sp. ZM17-4 TaxID=2866714 RepID=UPI001C731DA6|nr:CheR family methyltransferase [Oscillochloris sp. ZM17-4]MBX0330670.1 PAS domain-containing protein [Oscillochloris sp. ZM17-4]